jgi:hypothetical protein
MKLPILIRIDDPESWPGAYLVFYEVEKYVASGYLIESQGFVVENPTADAALEYAKTAIRDADVNAFDQKWDGCQNIDFTRRWVHTCGDNHADNIASNLKAIRKHGLALIEQAGGNILK